ncbi:MAG: N-acetylmannosamine-6-phosphate 2-epimerase [Clostridiales bacterium]|nr:N-acetylmannosamine-6-phosphate 2-epimerase [Clostridiales bacterium]
MTKEKLIQSLKGQLIVSCQALPEEPLYVEEKSIMYLMARAAKQAGAAAIRTSSIRDVIAIKKETALPVIGLIKKTYPHIEPFITPTMAEVDALYEAKADIIALDCTLRPRENGKTIQDFLSQIKATYPDVLLMADISTFEEGLNACQLGVDFIGTTLSGYTPYSPALEGPDFALVEKLCVHTNCPVIAEGRIHTPGQAAQFLQLGAHAVVVGGAITRPLEIASRFVKAVREVSS